MYYTYVLISDKDQKFYIGHTQNLKSRFERHQAGFVPSTAPRRPLRLIFYEAYLLTTRFCITPTHSNPKVKAIIDELIKL